MLLKDTQNPNSCLFTSPSWVCIYQYHTVILLSCILRHHREGKICLVLPVFFKGLAVIYIYFCMSYQQYY